MAADDLKSIDIADIKRLTLGPEEILVVKINATISPEHAKRINDKFINKFPSMEGRILIIDRSVTLSVISQAEAATEISR